MKLQSKQLKRMGGGVYLSLGQIQFREVQSEAEHMGKRLRVDRTYRNKLFLPLIAWELNGELNTQSASFPHNHHFYYGIQKGG